MAIAGKARVRPRRTNGLASPGTLRRVCADRRPSKAELRVGPLYGGSASPGKDEGRQIQSRIPLPHRRSLLVPIAAHHHLTCGSYYDARLLLVSTRSVSGCPHVPPHPRAALSRRWIAPRVRVATDSTQIHPAIGFSPQQRSRRR